MTFSTTVQHAPAASTTADVPTPSSRLRSALRTALAAMIVGSTIAVTVTVAVAGAGTVAASASSSRGRLPDPIADQASLALALWREYEAGGDASTLSSYASQRDEVAASVANRLLIDPATMQRAWMVADPEHQEALLAGLTQLGVPYRRNTSKEGEGFDCSGLTTYAWGQAGFTLQRQSSAQIRQAAARTFETAQAGDLVQYPGHVMMWLGVGKAVLHSPYSGRNVEVVNLSRRSLKVGDPTGA